MLWPISFEALDKCRRSRHCTFESHLSIFVTAHLYNALRQLNLVEIQSPEFERIIDLHKGAIFANDVPVTPADMYRRMAYRTGLTGNQKRFNQKQSWKFTTGVASASLRQLVESK